MVTSTFVNQSHYVTFAGIGLISAVAYPAALSPRVAAKWVPLAIEDCRADQGDGEQSRSSACVRRGDFDESVSYRFQR